MYNIHLLPASFGDSIFIEYGEEGNPHYILIDGGPYFAFDEIITQIKNLAPDLKVIELLVITHIDIDHIDGIVKLLNRDDLPFIIQDVWFNGYDQMKMAVNDHQLNKESDLLGALQGEYLTTLIKNKNLKLNSSFKGKAVFISEYSNLPEIKLSGGILIKILGPGLKGLKKLIPVWKKEVDEKIGSLKKIKERLQQDTRYDSDDELLGNYTIEEMQGLNITGDKSEANGSSIAFIATYEKKSCLFAGDLPSDYLLEAIEIILEEENSEFLNIEAWKLAHHGSKKSTSDKLMKKINCKKILISSDGKKFKHPDEICIAKLLKHNGPNLEFFFNYKTEFNNMWDKTELKEKYQYTAQYPDNNDTGISLKL